MNGTAGSGSRVNGTINHPAAAAGSAVDFFPVTTFFSSGRCLFPPSRNALLFSSPEVGQKTFFTKSAE